MPTVHLIDYVAGNIRSLVNAIEKVGYTVAWIKTPEDVQNAEVREPFLFMFVVQWCCVEELRRIAPHGDSLALGMHSCLRNAT